MKVTNTATNLYIHSGWITDQLCANMDTNYKILIFYCRLYIIFILYVIFLKTIFHAVHSKQLWKLSYDVNKFNSNISSFRYKDDARNLTKPTTIYIFFYKRRKMIRVWVTLTAIGLSAHLSTFRHMNCGKFNWGISTGPYRDSKMMLFLA